MTARYPSPAQLAEAARAALDSGREASVIDDVAVTARQWGSDASSWQWAGLLYRSLQDHRKALAAFARASDLAPDNALIAMSLAQVQLEAGLDAAPQFERAIRLSPTGDALLGLTASRYARGEGRAALSDLAAILDRNPLWVQGHRQWAQLAAMTGEAARATETIDRAIAAHRETAALWGAKIDLLEQAERHEERRMVCEEAIAATGNPPAFALARAAALSDSGDDAGAQQAFARLGVPTTIDHAIRLARHLIRLGERASLARLADEWMAGSDAHLFWPYASIAWRWTAPDRWQWLEGDERLIRVVDLAGAGVDLNQLAMRLRALHGASGRFLDQSVRGGTQTDGPLLSRLDAEVVQLRAALVSAIDDYVRGLPPVDPGHPMLSRPRSGPVRFAGSWSVRLGAAGYHAAHVHPQGWISSAFYCVVPPTAGDAGRLVLGSPPPDLRTDLPPIREVEPIAGRLVLFPSMIWHGTLPFGEGERMTVAFDVAPCRDA
ncbi:2OG-Fe(II) oxygenase family protein [Sphingomonas jaspsi]|uniref:2OG-Fe(II) oxygenase family protein n=1 Tax=Sphingomonas jaspsi TaxID=392409 RepID=UPI0012EBD3EC|nr:putative 2OG-Fe(II) oxygenase [Sphingomonas jaspsi]